MAEKFDRIKNFNVSVKESRNNVIFLRKLVEGGNAHSFGIHVARMSGMPKQIINSATKMLKKLESSHELKKSNRRSDRCLILGVHAALHCANFYFQSCRESEIFC